MPKTTRELIELFLSRKRLAVVGVSREDGSFSRKLLRSLRQHGYEATPVNPHTAEMDGAFCAARVKDIQPAVEAALVMATAKTIESRVRDCLDSDVPLVWVHMSAGPRPLSASLVQACRDKGTQVIMGFCPLMFLGKFPHSLHGFFARRSPAYRKAAETA
jgi:uncharacterized protein